MGQSIRWPALGYEEHLKDRPQLNYWHPAIGLTLGEPYRVGETADGGWDYYRDSAVAGKKGRRRMLKVCVRWTPGGGIIATAHAVDRIARYANFIV